MKPIYKHSKRTHATNIEKQVHKTYARLSVKVVSYIFEYKSDLLTIPLSKFSFIRKQQRNIAHVHVYQNGSFHSESTPLLTNHKSDNDDDDKHIRKSDQSRPSLLRVVMRTYWKEWLMASFCKIVCDALSLLQPILLR